MSDYTWPGFPVTRFQMRVEPVVKVFASPYSNQVQAIDMMAEAWHVQGTIAPGVAAADGRAIQAFFDRLKGAANRILLWDLTQTMPSGTMRGTPTVGVAAAQFANTVTLATGQVGCTLNPGDPIGIGGQLVHVLVGGTADASGNLSIEFAPRLRTAMAVGTSVVWSQPTAPFILVKGGVAVDWEPGMYTGPSFELRESV